MWTELLQTHGYWILALGCLLEGETVLILAGYAAHRGLLDPVAVLAIASLSGFAGDQGFFWLGRRHGAGVIARFPSVARQSERMQRLIERWHEAVIVGVRFAYGLRVAGPILIGASAVPAGRFAAFNALGAVLWATTVGGIGWVFGAAAQAVLGRLHAIEGRLLDGLVGVLLAAALVRAVLHRRAARAARAVQAGQARQRAGARAP
jgi:membrane protein DedA with SNARE-associated domain